ncbi:MAG: NAD(P)H-binding protein [Deltaproteobacteria bacterium]|nr:NAD(P)H-binding protein [Deltaproteobacteria bacterium]
MRVIVFGASGMVGLGVLRECLVDPGVTSVVAVVRAPLALPSSFEGLTGKLVERVHRDFLDLEPLAADLADHDACFFCLGTSAAGMKAADYRRVNHEIPLVAARMLARVSPRLTFLYVSGAGTDNTGKSRWMWARVKGETENALLALPFARVHMLRPGLIQPRHGITSRTRWLRVTYTLATPLLWALRPLGGRRWMTDTSSLGRAMLHIARHGAAKPVLENADLVAIARAAAAV